MAEVQVHVDAAYGGGLQADVYVLPTGLESFYIAEAESIPEILEQAVDDLRSIGYDIHTGWSYHEDGYFYSTAIVREDY